MDPEATHYSALGVKEDADMLEIQQAYNERVEKLHPEAVDEHLDAMERIGQAYEVLTDPTKRAAYDDRRHTNGRAEAALTAPGGGQDLSELTEVAKNVAKQAVEAPSNLLTNETLVKLTTVLTKTIGGGATFEEFIGTAGMATSAAVVLATSESKSPFDEENKKDIARLQEDREFALAKQLAQRLHQFVAGDEDAFVQKTREEALRLSRLPFGVPLLHRIGYMYEHSAAPFLGNIVGEWFRNMTHRFGTQAGAYSSYVSLGLIKYDFDHSGEDGAMKIAEIVKFLEERMGWTISSAWNLIVKDLEDTLRDVCRTVLQEPGVTAPILVRRAQALHRMGVIFQEVERPPAEFDPSAEQLQASADLTSQRLGTVEAKVSDSARQGADALSEDAHPTSCRHGSCCNRQCCRTCPSGDAVGYADGKAAGPTCCGGLERSGRCGQLLQRCQDNAEPTAQTARDQVIQPAADAVKQHAQPLADTVSKQGIRPAVQAVQEGANRAAEVANKSVIQPAADAIQQGAQPLADQVKEQGIRPAKEVAQKLEAAQALKQQVLDPGAQAAQSQARPLAEKAAMQVIDPTVQAVQESQVLSDIFAGANIEGETVEDPYLWYFTTIYEAFSSIFGRVLVAHYWSMKPDDVYCEELVEKFLGAMGALLADNVLQMSLASQVLHIMNCGTAVDLTERLDALKISRDELPELNVGEVFDKTTLDELKSAAPERVSLKDNFSWLYERHVSYRGKDWDYVHPDLEEAAKLKFGSFQADDEEHTPPPAQADDEGFDPQPAIERLATPNFGFAASSRSGWT
eukprot:jgi/Botrbrau1/18186/Bobra.53_1s0051.1